MSIPSYQSPWSDSQVANSTPLPQPSYLQPEPARLFQCEPQLSTLPHTTFAALKPQAAATPEPGSKQVNYTLTQSLPSTVTSAWALPPPTTMNVAMLQPSPQALQTVSYASPQIPATFSYQSNQPSTLKVNKIYERVPPAAQLQYLPIQTAPVNPAPVQQHIPLMAAQPVQQRTPLMSAQPAYQPPQIATAPYAVSQLSAATATQPVINPPPYCPAISLGTVYQPPSTLYTQPIYQLPLPHQNQHLQLYQPLSAPSTQPAYQLVPGSTLQQPVSALQPMRALRGLTAAEIQPRQLALQWEPLGYNLTRCHTYTLSLCYRYSMPTGGNVGNNATVRECLSVDRNTSHFTLRDLPPFRSVHVRLALANPEGKKESREVIFQTEEDIPGGIAPESLTFTPLDDMIFLKWEEPVEPNGLITQYEISYQSIESSDPGINVPGPRRTVSKLRNETYHMFSGLHPGTTYLVSVRARTAKGFGQTALTEITTNISAPVFDYEDIPSPLSESENTITVLLRPALGRGAPVSAYQVVVVEEDGSRRVRRRELGAVDCFPAPNSYNEAQAKGAPHYYTAELAPSSLPEATPFTVGDNHTYNGYWNSPLDPTKNYLIYFQATSNFRGRMQPVCSGCCRVILQSRKTTVSLRSREKTCLPISPQQRRRRTEGRQTQTEASHTSNNRRGQRFTSLRGGTEVLLKSVFISSHQLPTHSCCQLCLPERPPKPTQ
ncbi:hypothetical protein PAMP_007715 [Pampus punctatissimus]